MTDRSVSRKMTPEQRGSYAALRRAAQMARRTAIETDTGIAIYRDGKIVRISAAELKAAERAE